ncbi:type VII secretion protein EccB [Yinghuangia seranimata]|uniref:type VII secretion protein EccB n=1 Tax=Yinghuangia seranimata TaxID=408067 RepID=UPI00248A9769|nr:type VII secretion protein EccB [Yinghuangia seranimata]MDI2132466.1 type VII secretion protein EccB [Yinghuangia seranimata]
MALALGAAIAAYPPVPPLEGRVLRREPRLLRGGADTDTLAIPPVSPSACSDLQLACNYGNWRFPVRNTVRYGAEGVAGKAPEFDAPGRERVGYSTPRGSSATGRTMASRREQLEAYVFARRRLVAGFVQPEPSNGGAAEEKAPRPFRALLPGLVVGALILTGFGVYGLIRPGTPPGWKDKGSLIVGRDSASRYVYLDGKLRPVLNIASGRLLLDPGKFKVNLVPEKVLNSVEHGSALGIPNAPDRLPSAKEVAKPKPWTVCEQPVQDTDGKPDFGRDPQLSVFVNQAPAQGVLNADEALFVERRDDKGTNTGSYYIVYGGRAYPFKSKEIRSALRLDTATPQPVTEKWLSTFEQGSEIVLPTLDGYGSRSANAGKLGPALNKVGIILRAEGGGQEYVVTMNGVMPISKFTASLFLARPDAKQKLYPDSQVTEFEVGIGELAGIVQQGQVFMADKGWPEVMPAQANRIGTDLKAAARLTVCNTYTGTYAGGVPQTKQSAWYTLPANRVEGVAVSVPPGTGMLIREATGRAEDQTGTLYLLTDTGLRYQIVNDPPQNGSQPSAPGADSEAKIRLGYKDVAATPVPRSWTELVPVGARLSVVDAKKTQTF